MPVRGSIAALGLAVVASSAGGCQQQKLLLISCTTENDHIDVVGLDLLHQRAMLLSASPQLTGTAHGSPTEYEVLFEPGPAGAARLLLKINRYTHRVTRELGPRAAETAPGTAAPSTGTCERYRAKPL